MNAYHTLDDLELARLVGQERDHAAFTEIYKRHWQAMFIFANSILKNEDEASDTVQEIFSILWKRTAEIDIGTSLKAYLYTATRHQALRAIRRNSQWDAYAAELARGYHPGMESAVDDTTFRELCTLLDAEVAALPPRMREIFLKSRHEGLSHRQIAEELGITEDSSRTMLHRALNILRAKLHPFLSLFLFLLK